MHWSLSQSLHAVFPSGASRMRPEADPRSAWDMTAQRCASVAQQLNLRQTQKQTLCWCCAHHLAVVAQQLNLRQTLFSAMCCCCAHQFAVAAQQLKLRQTLFQALLWFCANHLPRLLERLVSAKEQQGEEYRLLLKLLLHTSHLKVLYPICLRADSCPLSVLLWLQGIAHHLSCLYDLQLASNCLAMTACNASLQCIVIQ